jgi:threonine aldolase
VELNFASDNSSGVHPSVLDALHNANSGYTLGYGLDLWTLQAHQVLRKQFGADAEIYLVWSGTAANVLGIKGVLMPHQSILCAETAHLYHDETGAPEAHLHAKLVPIQTHDGKLTVEMLEPHLVFRGDIHRTDPRVVSIAQSTEYGTLYTPAEIRTLADWCHAHRMLLHLDGARIANAAAALDVPLRAITTDAGVDLLSFGGTKNGLMGAEAVLYLRPGLADHFAYLHKQGMQLSSKMRYLSAQILAYFADDLWLHNARHANAMTARLAQAVGDVPGVSLTQAVAANAIFATLPPDAITALNRHAIFHTWDPLRHEVRWMTSWQTTPAEVDAFAAKIREIVPQFAA